MLFNIYSINWPSFIVWLPLLLEIFGNMCIAIVCWPGCDVINFKTNLTFLIKPFSCMTKRSRQKLRISWKRKELLRWNKKHFLLFLSDFQLPKNLSDIRHYMIKNTIYTVKDMGRGLCNSITVLLKIKMKDKMKVELAFLPKV